MPRKRFTNEQIAFALWQAENNATADEVCRKMGVPERSMHEVDRGAAVEAVRSVGVPEPMRRDLPRKLCPGRRGLNDPVDCARIQRSTLPR